MAGALKRTLKKAEAFSNWLDQARRMREIPRYGIGYVHKPGFGTDVKRLLGKAEEWRNERPKARRSYHGLVRNVSSVLKWFYDGQADEHVSKVTKPLAELMADGNLTAQTLLLKHSSHKRPAVREACAQALGENLATLLEKRKGKATRNNRQQKLFTRATEEQAPLVAGRLAEMEFDADEGVKEAAAAALEKIKKIRPATVDEMRSDVARRLLRKHPLSVVGLK